MKFLDVRHLDDVMTPGSFALDAVPSYAWNFFFDEVDNVIVRKAICA